MSNYEISKQAVDRLLDQCVEAIDISSDLEFPANYKGAPNAMVCGMGGSNLSTHIIRSVFKTKVPLGIIRNYDLPKWVTKDTFILLSSYSGNTEETLSCGEQAMSVGCKVAGLTTGGTLQKLMKDFNMPGVVFTPNNNPGNMPRFALGYGIIFELAILSKLVLLIGAPELNDEFKESILKIKEYGSEIQEKAQDLAAKSNDKAFCVIAGGHLGGNGKVMMNQLNESSKSVAFSTYLPEADHNLVESFSDKHGFLQVFMMNSSLYSEKLKKRFEITKSVIEKSGYPVQTYKLKSKTLFTQALEMLSFSSYLSIFIAQQKGIDPLSIPSIDYIKENL